MRIAVVGAGTAGPAAGLFLSRDGHRVELFERAPALRPVGAGLLLQPTGLAVLDRLGLLAPVVERGATIRSLVTHTSSGRRLLQLDYRDLGEHVHGLGLQRAALLDVLIGSLTDQGVPIHCGVEVRGVRRRSEGLVLCTDDGERGPFDWVVVADGERSPLRRALGLAARVERYPWGAIWAVLPDPTRCFAESLVQRVEGTRRMVGVLPSGRITAGPVAEPFASSLFVSVRLDRSERFSAADLARLHGELRRLIPEAEPLLDGLREPSQLTLASYYHVSMPQPIRPGVAILGDAAHAMSPQLGQGANLALADGEAFARAVRESAHPDEVAACYLRLRRAQLGFYLQVTRWLTPFFQSDATPLAILRDAVFPALGAIPPLRGQMLRSMAGMKRGWLRRSMPIPKDIPSGRV